MRYILDNCSCGLLMETNNFCEFTHYLYENFRDNLSNLLDVSETANRIIMHYNGGYTIMIEK